MADFRSVKIAQPVYDQAERLRVRLLQAGVIRREDGKIRPMSFSGVIGEALDRLEKEYPARK